VAYDGREAPDTVNILPMKLPFTVTCLLLSILLLATACVSAQPQVELRGERFTVELALTRQQQNRGLMFRDHLPQDAGMLFIFNSEAPRSFWMKNTRIPLDILYFDADLLLVSMVENARPCAADPCPPYPSTAPAQYVLELNAGRAGQLGVSPGDQLVLLFEP
jgi:uncharacterized membrane protein (UPF0127 family)